MDTQFKLTYLLGNDYSSWSCSNTKYYSYVTPKIIIEKIIDLAKSYFCGIDDKVIWDMFAGIGCDSIRLAKEAGKVICTEIDKNIYNDLEKNAKNIDNIVLYNSDCCNKVDSIICNIIYFDPPWGDSFCSGQNFDFYDVKLDNGIKITDLAMKVSINHNLIIKSPISSDTFEELFGDRVLNIFTFSQQKLKFLFIRSLSLNNSNE